MPAEAIIHVGRGSVTVENPPKKLLEGLRRFKRVDDGSGEYEELYTLSLDGRVLVTLPGFAERVQELCRPDCVTRDERMPMPEPDLEAAMAGLPQCWADVVKRSVKLGGVVGIPEMLGSVGMMAAILRAYPRDVLVERGTPLSIIATHDRESARRTATALRKLLPDRDIGISSLGSYTDSDDVVVTPYNGLKEVPCWPAGVFIGDDLPGVDFTKRAEGVSAVRNAMRWGLYTTAGGGCGGVDLALEGLFGHVNAEATYADAVNAGYAVPITVCWLPCPQPGVPLGSAPFRMLEAIAMQNNEEFCKLAAGIVNGVSSTRGCLLCSEHVALLKRVAKWLPAGTVAPQIHEKTPVKERRALLEDVANGTIRRALVSYGFFPLVSDHSVMVLATCGGGDIAGWRIPWRVAKSSGDRAYIVDFRHEWDLHNGRPGRLALNDEARMRRFRELGFRQMYVDDVSKLPFMG